jgi:hypothetical protein
MQPTSVPIMKFMLRYVLVHPHLYGTIGNAKLKLYVRTTAKYYYSYS